MRIKAGEGRSVRGRGCSTRPTRNSWRWPRLSISQNFRDFLMLSDAMDASDALTVWSQSMEIDYGDVSLAFASRDGKSRAARGRVEAFARRPSGGVSRTVVAPLERAKIEYMLDSTTIARDGGLVGTLRRIIRNEGPGGVVSRQHAQRVLYRADQNCGIFVYDKIKDPMISTGDQTELDGLQRMLGGSIASMCGTALAARLTRCALASRARACSWAIVGSNSSRTKGTALFGRDSERTWCASRRTGRSTFTCTTRVRACTGSTVW